MTGKHSLIAIALTIGAIVATAIVYSQLPATVATHWGINGQPNGYSPKWTLYFLPVFMAGMMLLSWLLPWLSPKNFEVDSFRSTYSQLMLMFLGLLAYIDGLILWVGVGHSLDVSRAVVGGVSILFVLLGNVLGKVRRNFFIGVRTPWALANERVWNATHRVAAKTLVLSGLAGLALTVTGLYAWFVAVLLVGAIIPVVYSLYYYKRLERRGEL